jgi:hypothetical protein
MNAVVDNDIVHKGACYGILADILQPHNGAGGAIGALGTARFVVSKRIKKMRLQRNGSLAQEELRKFLSRCVELSPTEDEQHLAAEFEFAAQQLAVNLDTGESQLCAIVIVRVIPRLLTGDKRAITALERLHDGHPALQAIRGKVGCLEQAILDLVARGQLPLLRTAICSEPTVDKTLTICFGCSSAEAQPETVLEGLNSYINALRACASRVLAISL